MCPAPFHLPGLSIEGSLPSASSAGVDRALFVELDCLGNRQLLRMGAGHAL